MMGESREVPNELPRGTLVVASQFDDLLECIELFQAVMEDYPDPPAEIRTALGRLEAIDLRTFELGDFAQLSKTIRNIDKSFSRLNKEYFVRMINIPFEIARPAEVISDAVQLVEAIESGEANSLEVAIGAVRRRALQASLSSAQPGSPPDLGQFSEAQAIFIGHGHSPYWRELKDYLQDDLGLDVVFYEQDSRVGEHIADVLEGMLNSAAAAVILLTRDDELADGRERARQNVVHETGYFQGKLGFKRVAMLVQRDLDEFSNVAGITPIRFDGRHISQSFHELRRWLSREGLLP